MLDNIASLIDRYGHMPNGNRSYYLSRSQPPFFSCMVELIAAHDGDEVFVKYLPELQAEYDYWMDGADRPRPRLGLPSCAPPSRRRRCSIATGTTAPRRATNPIAQDVDTARHTNRPAAEVYRDLRAGAETGWDFSSRWLADGKNLWTIRTTAIAPVDLNALMVHLEQTLAKAYRLKGDAAAARALSGARGRARRGDPAPDVEREGGFFADYLWREGRQSDVLSAATAVPLYFGIATPDEAHAVADALARTAPRTRRPRHDA